MEVVLRDDSLLIGRTALETRLRNRFNVNLIAVSRKGEPSFERLKSFRFKTGDILLMQVPKSIQQDIYIYIYISTVLPPWSMVTVLMILTIIMTNLISNTATTVLMAPIALSLSKFMGVSPDSLLMCVAVASSTAFLTPIGHQSNMLVMGPGGYRFTDYWKLGLPLAILVVTIGTPLILYVWPF